MKIILCYPPKREYPGYGQEKRWLPLGIASLGAYIKREYPDIDITLLDLFDYTEQNALDEICKHIKTDDINIIGFTCFTEQRMSTLSICEGIKARQSFMSDTTQMITVVGGPHAFLMAEQISNEYPYINHIIKGEGEKAFCHIIDTYKECHNGYRFPEMWAKATRESRIFDADIIHDLDSLPHAIDGFDLFANVPKEIEAEAPIVMSRGCTDYCSFCSTTKFWKGYRSRSAPNVFSEMMKYYEKYGTTKFKFHDDASTADLNNWKMLCHHIHSNNLNWEYEITARADQFDDELIDLLAKSGCKRVAVGIESGNEGLRQAMNKRLDMDLAKANMRKLMQAGIEVVCLFIVGYPGESESTIQETIEWIREVRPSSWCCQPLMVFPGTKVYRDCVNDGWLNDDYWLNDLPQPYYVREQPFDKLREWTQRLLTCMQRKKILIAAPVHQDERVFKMYLDSLRKLEIPDGFDIYKVFVLHNCRELQVHVNQPNEFNVIYDSQSKYEKDEITHYWQDGNFKDMVKMKNGILDIVKNEKFDYVFFVDSDIILQPETLKQLLKADKDIVAEVFWTKWNGNDPNQPMLPNAWACDQYNFIEGQIDKWKQPGLYRVGMTGACTLIKRHVIEAGVNWSPIPNVSYSFWEDRAFCIRASVLGFEIWLDTNCEARHLYRESEVEAYLEEVKNNGI